MRQHGPPERDRLGARGILAAALLAAMTVAVYWGAWRFEFVNFDDDIAVLQNPRLAEAEARSLPHAIAALFRFESAREYLPVRDASYLFDLVAWGGPHPGGFHLTNLVLHVGAGILLMRLAILLGASAAASVLAGVVFLLHPIQVESVAWVSGRKDLLAALFAFASWIAHERRRTAASAALFLAGGLSKATIVPLPVLFLASDTLRDGARRAAPARGDSHAAGDGRAGGSHLARVTPHLVIAALVAGAQIVTSSGAGMLGAAGERGPLASLLSAAKLPFLYLANILWPADLHLLYSPRVPDPRDPVAWLALLALAALIALVVRARRRSPLLAIGGAAFLLLLAPTLGLIPFQLLMADRYAYLPMAGIALALAGAFVSRSEARQRTFGRAALTAAVLIAIPLALVAHREARAWRDSEALWMREIARDATHADAWHNLGTHALNEARAQRARGDMAAARDRAERAASHLERAAGLGGSSIAALVNWALAASLAGDHATALRAMAAAREAAPKDPLVRYNSACVHAQAGDLDRAFDDLEEALAGDGVFAHTESLMTDADLAPLRSDPRFAALLQKARTRRARPPR